MQWHNALLCYAFFRRLVVLMVCKLHRHLYEAGNINQHFMCVFVNNASIIDPCLLECIEHTSWNVKRLCNCRSQHSRYIIIVYKNLHLIMCQHLASTCYCKHQVYDEYIALWRHRTPYIMYNIYMYLYMRKAEKETIKLKFDCIKYDMVWYSMIEFDTAQLHGTTQHSTEWQRINIINWHWESTQDYCTLVNILTSIKIILYRKKNTKCPETTHRVPIGFSLASCQQL